MNIQSHTALVYDTKCLEHYIPIEKHETPDRIRRIQEKLAPLNLRVLEPRRATREDILRCHTPEYLEILAKDDETVKRAHAKGKLDDGYMELTTGDTGIWPGSIEVAYWAAGGVLQAVDAVMQNVAKNVFCNIRPPGHHATQDKGMGFCIFNNVACGARYAQEKYGLKRVLIVDWDVHHGNGTQDIFYNDQKVFYFSTHQKGLYPNTGLESEMGEHGTTCNHRVEVNPFAREVILQTFRSTLQEKMHEFQPELVMISAGFDARRGDPLGHLNLTDGDFTEMTRLVQGIANKYAKGRVVSVLEGGYNLEGIASAAFCHVKALMEG
jgi:acetoin utilization deacetylase AcuC-like enzyme